MTDGLTIQRGSDTFLNLAPDGTATGYNGHVDLGTGLQTALAQIVAEELDLPLTAVRMVLGDTARTPDQGPTIASESIQIAALPLRAAAAQARLWLLSAGALRLNAPVSELATEDGHILWRGNRLPYAALLDRAVTLPLDPDTPVKDPSHHRIVGHKATRTDLPAKLTGSFDYIHDIRLPGMLHGHVIRPPYAGRDSGPFIGRSLAGYDETAVSQMEGYVATVAIGDFLAVVATKAHLAQKIAEALPVQWHLPPDLPDLSDPVAAIKDAPSTPRLLADTGDVDTALAACPAPLTRRYVWPWHLHGSIGPSCAVADWNNGAPIVWSGTQNPHMLRADLATLIDLAPEEIEVRRHQAAGCYGRNCADDVAGDALLLTRALGQPVRVQLTRQQETLWEPKGAAQVMEVTGGLSPAKAFHAYKYDSWYPSNRGPNLALLLTGRVSAAPRPSDMGDRTIIPPYRIAHKRITVHDMAPLVRAAWLRGVSALPNTFAHESFVDELAAQAGHDPVAFRLDHMDDPRQADLIRRTAEQSGWQARTTPRLRRDGRMAYGQGFAFATYVHGPFPGTAAASAAWVVDVSVDLHTGEVALTRVFVGQDQGLVINPDHVRQQIHGNVIQTASRTLQEGVSFDAIGVSTKGWADYPVATFPQVPQVESMLIARPGDPPLGVGESAAVPAAAAIANAIFDATGVRMREAPFTPEKMRAALGVQPVDETPLAPPLDLPPPRKRKGLLAGTLGLAAALGLGALSFPLARSIAPSPAPAATTFSAEVLTRGQHLFGLGNCASCHTATNGAANAGGRAIETPFGTVYSTNLTPDPDTGLGRWSYAAFTRAMRHGISRDGRNLYPAFPYTSFARMDDADLRALYAYLQTLPPVRQQTPAAQMAVPRPAVAAWNTLFHKVETLTPDPGQSAAWNRGRYLVDSVGHCAACHTPRTALGAEAQTALSGATLRDWYAPALAGPDTRLRDPQDLRAYLATGTAPGRATASGPMAEVIAGLATLPADDITAMATYLASLATGPAPQIPPQTAPIPDRMHQIYESACASCHEPAHPDMLTAAQVSLSRAPALRAPGPEAAQQVIRNGLRAPDGTALRDMPGFARDLSQADIAALSRYLRTRYAPDLPGWN